MSLFLYLFGVEWSLPGSFYPLQFSRTQGLRWQVHYIRITTRRFCRPFVQFVHTSWCDHWPKDLVDKQFLLYTSCCRTGGGLWIWFLIVPYRICPNTDHGRFSVFVHQCCCFYCFSPTVGVYFGSGLVVFWVYGGVQCTMYAYKGCKKCFAICDQTVFLSPSTFAVHFARNILCWFPILIIFILPSSISKLSTFFFSFLKCSFRVIIPFPSEPVYYCVDACKYTFW